MPVGTYGTVKGMLPRDIEAIGAEIAAERGSVLVPPFDDPFIIEGQGTVGLEMLEQAGVPMDQLLCGASGGGLIAVVMFTGLARTVLRAMSPVSTPGWLFLASIGVVFAARAKVENLFGPFNSSTVIIVAAVAYGLIHLRKQLPSPRPGHG